MITEVVPALERIIGPQPPLPALESSGSQNRFNLVFQNFLRVFCREQRPLVVFLDDLQWADPASLRLLTLVLSAPGTESLLFVASCRNNEVMATHPFMLALKELERRTVPVETIEIGALGWADIAQLIGDSLGIDRDAASPLATAIREKTGGNPFFIRQFLQKLHTDALLSFDEAQRPFVYDLEAIRRAAITENVADLIAQKIGRLDANTQRVVSFGAAIGNRFELATLAAVAECAVERAAELLAPAVRENLLVRVERYGRRRAPTQYAFQHDRVQQAAYALVPAAARPALNLSIGRALLAGAGDDVTGVLFEVVNHMNQGIALIDTRVERMRLAKLNLLAATRRAQLDGVRRRRARLPRRDRAARLGCVGRHLRARIRGAPAARGMPDAARGLRRRVPQHRCGAAERAHARRSRTAADRAHAHLPQHGRHDGRGVLRCAGGAVVRPRPAGTAGARARAAAARDRLDHRAGRTSTASRACSSCRR